MFSLNYTYESTDSVIPPSKNLLYLDIETTGLQKKNALIYLIGCAGYLENGWKIHQWFAENPDEESNILNAFAEFLKDYEKVCHFNGNQFDIPFLSYRFELHKIENPLGCLESVDFYRELRPCKKLLALSGFRQKDLEEFLKLPRECEYTGKDCIQIYREMIKYRDLSYMQPLLWHNREDVQGLVELEAMKSYLNILNGNFKLDSWEVNTIQEMNGIINYQRLLGHCRLPQPLPQPFSSSTEEIYLTGKGDTLEVEIPMEKGLLKNYYENYQDYYYLPQEDMAIHKSVSEFVDRNLRKQATQYTCYTKFNPEDNFTKNPSQAESFFRQNVPHLLKISL